VSGQLILLPTTAPQLRRESLPLDVVEGFEDAAPSAKLRELICDLGLLQPVVVVPVRSGRYRVVEGRRRCKAIAQLAEAGEWPLPARVDALVVEGRQSARREVRGGLTLALHASRTPSPYSELQAIEAILDTDAAEGETVTLKEIAAQTGISLQTVRRRLRLRALTPALRAAFDGGEITAGAAEAAARLPEAHQQALERQLEEAGRLTLADVRHIAREQTTAATTELPEGLFEQHEVAWQVTVRGHLTAALHAIPSGTEHEQLQRVIGDALAAAEKSDAEPDA
jgi:ParB-like chromosome segregation protein Spo0J